jgi:hypothetical protein
MHVHPGSRAFEAVVWRQRFLGLNTASACDVPSDFARLSARFSLRDFADFLPMLCRGDLSVISLPL